MNTSSDSLMDALRFPAPKIPKVVPAAEQMINELKWRHFMAEKEMKPEQSLEITALIGGVEFQVQRVSCKDDLLIIETYEDGASSVTLACSSAVALTLSLLEKKETDEAVEKTYKFMGFAPPLSEQT